VYSAALEWDGSTLLPANAAFVIRYFDGALTTASVPYFVGVADAGGVGGVGCFFASEMGGALTSPKAFFVNSFDCQDYNATVQAHKQAASSNYLVFGGEHPIDKIYVWIATINGEPLAERYKILAEVICLGDPNNPPSGWPVSFSKLLPGGGAPGPTPVPTDPVVNAAIPALVVEGFPVTVTIRGDNFQDGATVEIIGNTTVNVLSVDFISETELEIEIIINADPFYPAPNNYDALVINPGGENGIGIAIFASAP
jgi:hypothetical protein